MQQKSLTLTQHLIFWSQLQPYHHKITIKPDYFIQFYDTHEQNGLW